MDADAILAELVDLAERRPDLGLLQFRSWASAAQYRRLYRVLRTHVPEGTRVLDWGSGNGHFSYFLRRAGYDATGFSIHDPAPDAMVPEGRYRFVRGNVDDPVTLPFAEGSFDAAASIGVLEHVQEGGGAEERSLLELRRVLKPGGVLICYHFPNRGSWIDLLARRFPRMHHHMYRYTRDAIEALAAGAGLDLVLVERYGALPRNAWHAAPRAFRRSRTVARFWDALDAGLSVLLSPLCQNYLFVARKPAR